MTTVRRLLLRGLFVISVVLAIAGALFVVNGTLLSHGETPVSGISTAPPTPLPTEKEPKTVKIMAYNIAKCFAYEGGRKFASVNDVRNRIATLAAIIKKENPDLVFLSETVTECSPCPVNQVAELAEAAGLHQWVFGENYNFGVPGFRMVGGNAILSRWPLQAVSNPALAGRKPFYVTKNNRRMLWCKMAMGSKDVYLGSVHNDSFEVENNEKQISQILDFCQGKNVILAGDFNSLPEWGPIRRLREAKQFVGNFDGPPTFPADAPERRIDFIFAPATWKLRDERILCDDVSDHCALVASFERP
jgi:endonuclease/exonuclease/phosphatase family metal-dependent hydrolase